MWCVADASLHLFWPIFNRIWMVGRPVPSKILSVDRKFQSFWVKFLYFFEHIIQFIMKLRDKILGIVERLVKELTRILAWHRDILRQKISSSPITRTLSIVMNWKIRSMYFLGSNPKDIRPIVAERSNLADELVSGGQLEWWVLIEDKVLVKCDLRLVVLFH